MTFHTTWDPAFLITCIVGILAAAAFTVTSVRLFLKDKRVQNDDLLVSTVAKAWIFATAAAAALATVAITAFPFQAQYLQYRPVSGTVRSVTSRFLSGGNNSVSQRFAVTMSGGQIYGCDDTRCSTLKPGDRVTILCERQWQWVGVPGWTCNWGAITASASGPAA